MSKFNSIFLRSFFVSAVLLSVGVYSNVYAGFWGNQADSFFAGLFDNNTIQNHSSEQGQQQQPDAPGLSKHFKSYERVQLNTVEAYSSVRQTRTLSFTAGKTRYEIELSPNDMRASNYRAEESMAGGITQAVVMTPVETYRGKVKSLSGMPEARFTISQNSIEGIIITPEEQYYLESAKNYVDGADQNEFVFYKASDVITDGISSCGVTLRDKVEAAAGNVSEKSASEFSNVSPAISSSSPSTSSSASPQANLRVVELATEADNEYVSALGSSVNANNKILSIMNQVDGVYQANLGITFTIVYQHTWASQADPYNATDPNAMLSELKNYWSANYSNISRDITHMWTGRDMDGNTIGIAYTGVLCLTPNTAYGISQRTGVIAQENVVAAHEIGHNFGATHTDGQTPADSYCDLSIMNSVTGSSQLMNFCGFSRTQINSYVQSNSTCLSQGPPANQVDFTASLPSNFNNLTVARGFYREIQIQLNPLNTFNGSIEPGAINLPNGVEVVFSNYNVYIGNGYGTLIFAKLVANMSAVPGSYNATITVSSGAIQHNVPISFTVSQNSIRDINTSRLYQGTKFLAASKGGKILYGDASNPSSSYSIFDTSTGQSTELPSTLGAFQQAEINDKGDVVANRSYSSPILYKNGQTTVLTPPDSVYNCGFSRTPTRKTTTQSLNNSGQVLLGCHLTSGNQSLVGYLYSNSSFTKFSDGNGDWNPVGLNEVGQVAGEDRVTTQIQKGFSYDNGILTMINSIAGGNNISIGDINNQGKILIQDETQSLGWETSIYDITSKTRTILRPPNGDLFEFRMNDLGDVIDSSADYGVYIYRNGTWSFIAGPPVPSDSISKGLGGILFNNNGVFTSTLNYRSPDNVLHQIQYIYINNQWIDVSAFMKATTNMQYDDTGSIYQLFQSNELVWVSSTYGVYSVKFNSQPTCTNSIDQTGQSFLAGGGSGTINVTAQPGCSWTAVSNDNWIGIPVGNNGNGSGIVSFTVANNTGGARTGTITVAGQTFTITQGERTVCTLSINPTSQAFPAAAGTGLITAISPGSCAQTAVSNAPWITITSGNSGTGSVTINYTVDFNSTAQTRTGSITVSVPNGSQVFTVNQAAGTGVTLRKTQFDFDGDGKADESLFRPSNGVWYLNRSRDGYTGYQFGIATDKLAPADYDGDGKADVAVYRNGSWFVLKSNGLVFASYNFGNSADIPVPADYDGDGKAELEVFRPSDNTWYQLNTTTNAFSAAGFGAAGDKPVPADYDGDGKIDIAIFRPSTGIWHMQQSRDGYKGFKFGLPTDIPVVGDYDGDGKADQAVFRSSEAYWYIWKSSTASFSAAQFGLSTDTPAPADYDGDGKTDIAVFRSGSNGSSGNWYEQRSSQGFTAALFGLGGDKVVENTFVP